jgi:hypothetical protein
MSNDQFQRVWKTIAGFCQPGMTSLILVSDRHETKIFRNHATFTGNLDFRRKPARRGGYRAT